MKKKKLWIIIGIIIIIAIIVAVTTLYFMDRAKYAYKIEKVTQMNYHIIDKENRYGVIDRAGNILIEPIYDMIQIPNPSKPIFICMADYDVKQKQYHTKVFNDKGEELFQGYDYIQAIPNETAEGEVPFEKTVLQYQKNGKYGMVNINGKEVTKPEYDQITSIAYKEGMLLVEQNEKFGVINMNGKMVIDIEYDSITADNYYNETTKYQTTGFIVSQKKQDGYKYGYINYKGHKVLDTEYTEIQRVTEIQDDKNVYLVALKEGQAGLLKNKTVILNYEYEDISYNAYNDVFVVQRNGKQGIVSRNGEIKITPEYDIILFGGIYINAKKGDDVAILDLEGNPVQEENVISKVPTQDGAHFIISDNNGIYKITDTQGNIVIDKDYTYIAEAHDNYYIVAYKNKNGIIDLTGKSLIELKYNSIYPIENTNLFQAYMRRDGDNDNN